MAKRRETQGDTPDVLEPEDEAKLDSIWAELNRAKRKQAGSERLGERLREARRGKVDNGGRVGKIRMPTSD